MNKPLFLIILSFALFAAQNAILMIPPLLVDIAADFDLSVGVAGQLSAATFVGWGFSSVLVGPLSDSFGRRPVALGGLTLMAAAIVASAFAPNFAVFMALRVITGVGGGVLPANSIAAASDVISPARRAQTIGALAGISVLSGAVSVPALALLSDWRGWSFAVLVSGLLVAAVSLFTWLRFPADRRERIRDFSFLSRYRSLLADGFFRAAVVVNASHRIAYWAIVNYLAAYLISAYGLSTGAVALPLFVASLCQVIGSFASGFVSQRRRRAVLIAAITGAGGLCGLALFALPLGLWPAVAAASLGAGLLSVAFPALVVMTTERSGANRATGVGLMAFTNQAGGLGGAALSGLLLTGGIGVGYPGVGGLCLAVAGVSALVSAMFLRQPPRRDS